MRLKRHGWDYIAVCCLNPAWTAGREALCEPSPCPRMPPLPCGKDHAWSAVHKLFDPLTTSTLHVTVGSTLCTMVLQQRTVRQHTNQ